jgi:hypothetical protein
MEATTIKAELVLDPEGKPKGRTSGNYSIRLHVEGTPADAYKVTYQLHPSYYDPVREVRDLESGFSEELTSYGDYVIQARVRTKDCTLATTRRLSDALREAHVASTDADVKKALLDIEQN